MVAWRVVRLEGSVFPSLNSYNLKRPVSACPMTSEGDATDGGDATPTSSQDSEDESECPLEVKTLPPLLPLHGIRIAPPEFIRETIKTRIRQATCSHRFENYFTELHRLAIDASFVPPTKEVMIAVARHIAKPNWNLYVDVVMGFIFAPVDK